MKNLLLPVLLLGSLTITLQGISFESFSKNLKTFSRSGSSALKAAAAKQEELKAKQAKKEAQGQPVKKDSLSSLKTFGKIASASTLAGLTKHATIKEKQALKKAAKEGQPAEETETTTETEVPETQEVA